MEEDAPAAVVEEDGLLCAATVTPEGRPPSLLSLSRAEGGAAGAGGGDDGEEAIVGVKVHYVEQSSLPNAAARVWEGRVESTAQRVADLVQALRGAERERLIVTVEEGGGVEGLSVKIFQKTEHGRKPLLKAPALAPLANPSDVLAAALRASAAQQEATRAALWEAQALNKTYQDEHQKMMGQLESAVANKDKLQDELLAQFVLLLNTKKAEIRRLRERLGEAHLAEDDEDADEEQTDDQRSEGERADDEGSLGGSDMEEEEEEEEEEGGGGRGTGAKKRASGGSGVGAGTSKKKKAAAAAAKPRVKAEPPDAQAAGHGNKRGRGGGAVGRGGKGRAAAASSIFDPGPATYHVTLDELLKMKKEEKAGGGASRSPPQEGKGEQHGQGRVRSFLSSSSSSSSSDSDGSPKRKKTGAPPLDLGSSSDSDR